MSKVEIINNVKVTTNDDGSQHFQPIEQPKSWFQMLKDWWKNTTILPTIRLRDLADPFGDRSKSLDDIDVGQDGKTGIEIGVEVKF